MFLISFLHTVSFLFFALPLAVTQYWKHSVFHGSHQVWHLLQQGGRGRTGEEEKNIYSLFLFTFRMHQILDTTISVLCPSDFVMLVLPPLGSKTGWTGELWSKTSLLKNKRIALFCQFSFFYNFRFFETKKHDFSDFFLHFQIFWDFQAVHLLHSFERTICTDICSAML